MFKWIFDKTLVAQGMAAQNTSGRISTIDIQQGPALLKRHQRSLDSKLRQNLYKSTGGGLAPLFKSVNWLLDFRAV